MRPSTTGRYFYVVVSFRRSRRVFADSNDVLENEDYRFGVRRVQAHGIARVDGATEETACFRE